MNFEYQCVAVENAQFAAQERLTKKTAKNQTSGGEESGKPKADINNIEHIGNEAC